MATRPLAQGRYNSILRGRTQQALSTITRDEEELEINPFKSVMAVFTRRIKIEEVESLRIQCAEIGLLGQTEILKVVLDLKLTWN